MINDDTDDLTDEIADSTGQRPEYELTDDSHAGQRPEWELVEHSPPPPDEKVIDLEEARRHGQQRSWLLCTFIRLLFRREEELLTSVMGMVSITPTPGAVARELPAWPYFSSRRPIRRLAT
jgi:hypothetical protein